MNPTRKIALKRLECNGREAEAEMFNVIAQHEPMSRLEGKSDNNLTTESTKIERNIESPQLKVNSMFRKHKCNSGCSRKHVPYRKHIKHKNPKTHISTPTTPPKTLINTPNTPTEAHISTPNTPPKTHITTPTTQPNKTHQTKNTPTNNAATQLNIMREYNLPLEIDEEYIPYYAIYNKILYKIKEDKRFEEAKVKLLLKIPDDPKEDEDMNCLLTERDQIEIEYVSISKEEESGDNASGNE